MPHENVLSNNDSSAPELTINELQIKKAALCYRALNHSLRQQIIQLIHTRQRIMVTEIYQTLGLEQSVASQHLAILRRAGFVLTTRSGKCIYYHIHYERLEEISKLTGNLLK